MNSADTIANFMLKVLAGEQTFVVTPALSVTNNRRRDLIDMMDEFGRYSLIVEQGSADILFTNVLADFDDMRARHVLKTYALLEEVFVRLHHGAGKKVSVKLLVGKRDDLHDWFTKRGYTFRSQSGITYAQKTF